MHRQPKEYVQTLELYEGKMAVVHQEYTTELHVLLCTQAAKGLCADAQAL
jgi:hypothetical protein